MQGLLRTKFFIPRLPPAVVARPHLLTQLDQSLAGKLSLIVAPAGYGKTTLVTTWLQQRSQLFAETAVIWLSLHDADNDPQRFFSYVVTGLSQLDPSFTDLGEPYLQNGAAPFAPEPLVVALLNQLTESGRSIIFILDDYHEIKNETIHQALSFWLEHQPPSFHLLLTSRTIPPFPQLSRLRVRRQVTEIDAHALRFSQPEATTFLNDHMGLNLTAGNIAQLDQMTEGWVASLQLAALSLQKQSDPTSFIQAFGGNDQFVLEYLVNEVISQQPDEIRNFLLHTSILERLTAPLCNAVTKRTDSQTILTQIQQTRLFIIPLDEQRRWFRYHHLFADGLRAELLRGEPEKVPHLHERASRWFEAEGLFEEAIMQAFAAQNDALAGKLIGQHARSLLTTQGDNRRLMQWLAQLTESIIANSPQLLIAQIWLELYQFPHVARPIEPLLAAAEGHLKQPEQLEEMGILADVKTEIALAKAYFQQLHGNMVAAIRHNEEALRHSQTAVHPFLKAGAQGALATSHYFAGNIAQFLTLSQPQRDRLRQTPTLNYAQWVFHAYIIDALYLHGQLTAATQLYAALEPKMPTQMTAGLAMLTISWANLLRERHQLDEAERLLLTALRLLKQLPSMKVIVQTGAIALARTQFALGKRETAVNQLLATTTHFPLGMAYYPAARSAAIVALLQLRQGNRHAAQQWAAEAKLETTANPVYLQEIDYLIFARLLIAENKPQQAYELLGKLKESVQQNGRVARLIEILLLQAIASQALGQEQAAVALLIRAVRLAAPEAFSQLFLDEGSRLISLLEQVLAQGVASPFVQQLLDYFGEQETAVSLKPPSPQKIQPHASLLNSLTERELTTLRYLATNLTVPAIAEQMVVAPSTIRTYVKRIYGKLNAHTRIEAVNHARQLGLLE